MYTLGSVLRLTQDRLIALEDRCEALSRHLIAIHSVLTPNQRAEVDHMLMLDGGKEVTLSSAVLPHETHGLLH